MENRELLFKVEHLYKSFGPTNALTDVTLELERGQTLGLIGENGSGKSTLASIVAGIQKKDKGSFYLEGKPYEPKDTKDANVNGICIILQETGTFDQLTVAQNIFIGKENLFTKAGVLNNKKMEAEAQKALSNIEAGHIHSDRMLASLSFEDRKLVEVARAQILIIDETTTALSKTGRDVLYKIIEKMKRLNRSIIFISHDIDELIEICDKLTILRDGVNVGSLNKEEFDAKRIKSMMVGRKITDDYYRTDLQSSKRERAVLKMEGVDCGILKKVSLNLYQGEILGIGGLTECGMHELGKAVFGLLPLEDGKITTGDGTLIQSPAGAMKHKIAYISKNRDQESLMVASTIKDNVCIASYPKLKKGPFIFPRRERSFVNEWTDKLQIKMNHMNQFMFELSGGNKQKVVMAKWLGFGADIFIMDCPTRGIDVGVKARIYSLMQELKEEGKSILLISEELPEVLGMSDRIVILKDGCISGEFLREEKITENDLIQSII